VLRETRGLLSGSPGSRLKASCPDNFGYAGQAIVLNLMLPNSYNPPSQPPKPTEVPLVASAILLDFSSPEWLKLVFPGWESIAMPEVTVNEDRELLFYQHEVGTAWKSFDMLSEPEAAFVKFASNQPL